MTAPFIPLTLVTGFLGSGKTSLINRLLGTGGLGRASIYVNEAGEVGIDQALYGKQAQAVSLLEGGCTCCYQPGRLAEAIVDDLMRLESTSSPMPSWILVEASGIADPARVLAGLAENSYLRSRLLPPEIVSTLDAMAGLASLEEFCEARSQVELADHLVLTKAAGADADSLARLKIEALRLNGVARWHEAQENDFPSRFLAALHNGPHMEHAQWPPRQDAAVRHTRGLLQIVIRVSRAVPTVVIRAGLETLVRVCGEDLVRVKGVVHDAQGPIAIHVVRDFIGSFDRVPNPQLCADLSVLVFFAQNIRPEAIHAFWDALTRLRESAVVKVS